MPTIELRTITQQSFELEVENSETILQLKQKIAENKGGKDFPVDGQKLIYNGKVLEDNKTIGEVNVAAGKFIVVMVVKKAAPKASVTEATTTSEEKKSTTAEVKKEETPTSDKKEEGVPAEHQKTLDNITSMGYPRDEVIRALKAAFYNADRAVEYLCNGIPEGVNLVQGAAAGEASGDESGGEANVVAGEGGAGGLDFLANLPQFAMLREMIRNDPSALPQIMQEIAETRPELMQMIRDNQDQFLALLNAEGGGAGGAANPIAAALGGAAGAGGGGGPQAVTIPVTANDREAIDRLCGMGFPEQLVIEAYLACDKNEALAVNYILQRMEENYGGGN
uniref:UV excision repair protein RAD23 n=3 Tax=Meloidogyne enterolobii TaxID=390850 RepID=A0A6V7Y8G0_MELEN|nr:unnamed protein product [Meloidogyne enterolobii]